MQKIGLFIVAAAALLGSACASMQFGREFEPQAFENWVKQGKTQQAQVLEFLGEPTSRGIVVENDGTRYSRWLYYYGKGKFSRLKEADVRMLEIRFDAQLNVAAYNWSASSNPVPAAP